MLIATAIAALAGTSAAAGGSALTSTSIAKSRSSAADTIRASVVRIRSGSASTGRMGNGLVVRADGYILTSSEVVAGLGPGTGVDVVTADGQHATAGVIGVANGLAVLKASGLHGLTAASFADSDTRTTTPRDTPGDVASTVSVGGAVVGLDGRVLAVSRTTAGDATPNPSLVPANEAIRLAVEVIATADVEIIATTDTDDGGHGSG